MTEKRFESDGWKITDNETNEDIGMIKASKMLNQLHEEKEIDEKCYKELLQRYDKLKEENEQLKKELDCFKPLIFETDGMPITLYEKKDGGDVE